MRATLAKTIALGLLALMGFGRTLAAQEATADVVPAIAHVLRVSDEFRGTPENMGLLPTAVAEAEIAHRHATLAAEDPEDLDAMKRHAAHVLHALNPDEVEDGGPGLGYGVILAASRAAHYIELAAASEGATDGIRTHATHVATAARQAATRAEEALALANDIRDAEEPAEAAALLDELVALTDAILNGVDADGDGSIGWQEEEGGLAQATRHLDLLKQGEGLGN
jgi:hypothetical protein